MNILIVLTSHDQLGGTGKKTGFWLEEFGAPYYVFRDGGAEVTIASPKGGRPPIDPTSESDASQTADTRRLMDDKTAQALLANTARLSDMKATDFHAVFYSGGHGPLWDLAEDPVSIALIDAFYTAGKPIAAVCHGSGVLRHATANGQPLVKGRRVTGFSNSEEAAVHLTDVVPFRVEDELKLLGGLYEKASDWHSFAIIDDRLITGQNPASSRAVAQELMALLG
jgi:putative intracellular protease/amidase